MDNTKINQFLEDLKSSPDAQNMTGAQLLDEIKKSGIVSEEEFQSLQEISDRANKQNDAFKNSILSKVVYTDYDKSIEFINEQKMKGITPTADDIIASGTLNKGNTPMDVASLAFYAKTFTPVNLMPEGQFTVKNTSPISENSNFAAKDEMNMSYKNGVYRADYNIAMAMTVMSVGNDGKPELNVAFRGTDDQSKNQMVEADGSIVKKDNGLDSYVKSVYPDMEGHNRVAFSPLIKAINRSVMTLDAQNHKGYSLGNYNDKLSIVGTGHSLGGAMLEEWTKSNSKEHTLSREQRLEAIDNSLAGQKPETRKAAIAEMDLEEKNKEAKRGNLKLRSVAFGSPSNDRNSFGGHFTDTFREIRENYNEARRSRDAVNPDASFIKKTVVATKEIAEATTLSVLDGVKFAAKGLSTSEDREMQRNRDYKVMKRDLQIYNTPYDPVAKLIVYFNVAKANPNLNTVEPVAQKHETFATAIAPLSSQYPDGPKVEDEKPKVNSVVAFTKMVFSTAKTFALAVTGKALGATIDAVDLATKSITPFNPKAFVKKYTDITNHSMKAYSANSLMSASPIRDLAESQIGVDRLSDLQKLQMLVDLKGKKDIVGMEIIMKECGIENAVRDYKVNLEKGVNQPIKFEDLKRKGDAWINQPGEDAKSSAMTKSFGELRKEFGALLNLDSANVVTKDVSKSLQSASDKSNAETGLPHNIVPFLGESDPLRKHAVAKDFIVRRKSLNDSLKQFDKYLSNLALASKEGIVFGDQSDEIPKVRHLEPKEDPFFAIKATGESLMKDMNLVRIEGSQFLKQVTALNAVPPVQYNSLLGTNVKISEESAYGVNNSLKINRDEIQKNSDYSKSLTDTKITVKFN